jgi:4-hydroxy-4-methyl-2-oxoglutarate aldolase
MDRSAILRERFERLYCGVIYDAMCFDVGHSKPFVVDKAIKPAWKLQSGQSLFGHAFTCKGQRVFHEHEIDDKVRISMFREFSEGCIQVIDTGGDDTVAHFGDISGKIARKFGCRGAIVDGNTRDICWLEEDQFPLFCRGILPIDAYGKWQIVAYQVDIFLSGIQGGIVVSPNDYIYADPDGVLVIPSHLAEEVCSLAEARLSREDLIREKLKTISNIQKLYDEIGRW